MITLKQLKSKLEKDFGWENLQSDDNKWFVDNLLKDTIQAIEVITEQWNIANVVSSVFTIHSTENEGIIKIVGTEEEAKEEVLRFEEQHKYANFFYEKQNVS